MKDNSYIRIQDAAKQFWKTRQTLYNYINKWDLNTKKIHNKTYVSVRDLNALTNSFVGQKPKNLNAEKHEVTTDNTETIIDEDLQETIEKNDKTMDYLTDKINLLETQVQNIPNDFSHYTQQATSESKHYTDMIYSKIEWYLKNIQKQFQEFKHRNTLSIKKQQFAIGYTVFIMANIVTYILLVV